MFELLAEEYDRRARTKIVATVGPACSEAKQLRELIEAGADVFRLNTAHGSVEDIGRLLQTINSVRATCRPIGVLVDLAGPKIRLGIIPGDGITCRADDVFRFVRGDQPKSPNELCSNYERLVDDLQVGDPVLLADGAVGMVVTRKTPDWTECRVVSGGEFRSRQGINLPGVKIGLPALTPRDREFVAWASKQEVDLVSLSFVRSAAEIHELRELLRSQGSKAWIVAKIEKPEALNHLEQIVSASDAIMVARGDLGVEIDVAEVPVAQKRIINTCNRWQRPVIVATQMLDSMQHDPRPTRAEATDVANAILDGADACMLSAESAVGKYPVESVQMMNRIMVATERLLRESPSAEWLPEQGTAVHPVTRAVVYGAARIAECVHAKMVVIATRSGATALAKSSQRDFIPCIAVSPSTAMLRRMTLLWGVTPLDGAPCDDPVALREFVEQWGRAEGSLIKGDRIVLVAGTGLNNLVHNQVFVHEIEKK